MQGEVSARGDAWVVAGSEMLEVGPDSKGEVIIWDLQSREILQRLSAHQGGLARLFFYR